MWGGNRDKGIEKTRRMVKREKYLREKRMREWDRIDTVWMH